MTKKEEKNKEQRDLTFNGMTATEWAHHSRSVWKDLPSPKEYSKIPNMVVLPLELLYRLISMYSKEGDVVFDPFMGAGTTIISAIRNNRFCYGSEIHKKVFDIAKFNVENSINLLVNGDYELMNMDAFLATERIEDETIQLIITSPSKPSISKRKKKDENSLDFGDDKYEEYLKNIEDLMRRLYRITKKGGYAVFIVEDYRDIKNNKPYVEFHADIAKKGIKAGYLYQDVIIYDHNDQRGLLLQGYPKIFYANLNHKYIVVLRK